jgi:hypothetical protein
MSFYNIYVYVVTILVSRSCYTFMTTSRTMRTLPNVIERYRIGCSQSFRSLECTFSRHIFPANLPPFLEVCSCASSQYSFSYPRQYSKIHHISFRNLAISCTYLFAIWQYLAHIFSQSCNISHNISTISITYLLISLLYMVRFTLVTK